MTDESFLDVFMIVEASAEHTWRVEIFQWAQELHSFKTATQSAGVSLPGRKDLEVWGGS